MNLSVTEPAPAKLNLALHVTGRRADGYHLVESLVVFTRLGDRVSAEAAPADAFAVDGPFARDLPMDGGNLVLRARDALRGASSDRSRPVAPPSGLPAISPSRGEIGSFNGISLLATSAIGEGATASPISPLEGEMAGRPEGGATGRNMSDTTSCSRAGFPVAIRLTKSLPVASGIGGGSSDAAATLRALSRLWRLDLPADRLAALGLALGADVPMCLAARPLLARGIGEALEPVDDLPPLALVLVNPGTAVPTPAVFAALAARDNPPLPPRPPRPDFRRLVEWLASARNDLETPAVAMAPAIAEALAALGASGAALARMSGSGATCFGLFSSPAEAGSAAATIRRARPGWFVEATTTA